MNSLRKILAASPLAARVVPFVVFAAITVGQGKFGEASSYWFYFIKTFVGAWLIWLVHPMVPEMRWKFSWEAVVVGFAVFVMWVGIDPFYPPLDKLLRYVGLARAGSDAESGLDLWNPRGHFGEGSALAWMFIIARGLGSSIVVPPLEEIFYRSFVYRYLIKAEFQSVPLGQFHWTAFLISAAVFGCAHREWLAGILCGFAYQGLVCRKKRLGDAMTAHAITNFLLALWVVGRGSVEVLVNVPCVIFEDDHLLAVNKPAGMNTHAPGPYAGEGIYDWLRHREPRWARLAIIHRLDKETSGVLVFSKTELASHSLTEQFTRGTVKKMYLLLTDRPVRKKEMTVTSALIRAGEKYFVRPAHAGGQGAETHFRVARRLAGKTLVQAEPVTGRTHQIRAHASASDFPVLGDVLYGGSPHQRVCLHAQELTLKHPATGNVVTLAAPMDLFADARLALRSALIGWPETNACRLIHGGPDDWPGWYVDRLGDFLLSQSDRGLSDAQRKRLAELIESFSARGACHKVLTRDVRKANLAHVPQQVLGDGVPEEFVVRENGLQFALSFSAGCSVGLFLDQRDNRRRFLTGHVGSGFPLRWDGDRNLSARQEGSRHSDARERFASSQASAPEQFPSREGAGVGSTGPLVGVREQSPSLEGSGVGLSPPLTGMELLNTFAYTCGFSVCAAKAGAHTTSLDLSRKYLERGKRNFALNGLNTSDHDFIAGDVFDWLRRLARKQRRFDLIALDPPTFSQSKEHGVFQAEKDFAALVTAALPLLKSQGVLFVSTNASRFAPEDFLRQVTTAIDAARRKILQQHYAPQPPDFPITRGEPAYLKTIWMRAG